MWPPRPGDEGLDGSGVTEQEGLGVGSTSSKNLAEDLNQPVKTFNHWHVRLGGNGPPPGKRSGPAHRFLSQWNPRRQRFEED